MLEKPVRWYCDTCGEPIDDRLNNYVQWQEKRTPEGETRGYAVRIVHNTRTCSLRSETRISSKEGFVCDLAVESFLGADGLMRCLEHIADGQWPLDEGIETIKRLFIPGYEEARPLLESAVATGLIEPNLSPGFYWQHEIEYVIQHRGDLP